MQTNQTDELKKQILTTISSLAKEFQSLMESSTIVKEDQMKSSAQKLELDVHTMIIDQKARALLEIIRRIKEMKITDNSYQDERNQFEDQCKEAAANVKTCISTSLEELRELLLEGSEKYQSACKLLH